MTRTRSTEPRRRPSALRGRRRGWSLAVACVAALVVLPIGGVLVSFLAPSGDVWGHLWRTRLPEMLWTTVGLLVGVGVGTLVLGGGLAWLVVAYRFPGRRALSWLLAVPLAMPAYVLGFVFLSIFDFPGPVQTALRGVFGEGAWFPDVRSLGGAAIVLSLTLYPYVYLLARAALLEQAPATFEAARVLGHGRLTAARRVVLPLARPSLAAGLTLVMMETLTDFATVQYFNVQTISVGVFRVWKGMFDRDAAAELAGLVLLFALAVILLERAFRGRSRYHQGGPRQGFEAQRLEGWRAWSATGVCLAVLGAAFVGPVLRLVAWSGADTIRGVTGGVDLRFLSFLGNSGLLAGLAAGLCALGALVVANGARLTGDPATRGMAQLVNVGYALPGPVVAMGVLVVLAGAERGLEAVGIPVGSGLLVTGTIVGLVYAYVVRFMALSQNSVDASLGKVTPSMTMSALSLGASPGRVVRAIHLPLVRSGLGVALVLVAVDAVKELPIVLLLRPFGFETLSVWVWRLATESRWEAAALPALLIVAVAAVPVLLLFRTGRREAPPTGWERAAAPAPREPALEGVAR